MTPRELPEYLYKINLRALEHPRTRAEAFHVAVAACRNASVILEAFHEFKQGSDDVGLLIRDMRKNAMELRVLAPIWMLKCLLSLNNIQYNSRILESYKNLSSYTALLFDYMEPDLTERLEASL